MSVERRLPSISCFLKDSPITLTEAQHSKSCNLPSNNQGYDLDAQRVYFPNNVSSLTFTTQDLPLNLTSPSFIQIDDKVATRAKEFKVVENTRILLYTKNERHVYKRTRDHANTDNEIILSDTNYDMDQKRVAVDETLRTAEPGECSKFSILPNMLKAKGNCSQDGPITIEERRSTSSTDKMLSAQYYPLSSLEIERNDAFNNNSAHDLSASDGFTFESESTQGKIIFDMDTNEPQRFPTFDYNRHILNDMTNFSIYGDIQLTDLISEIHDPSWNYDEKYSNIDSNLQQNSLNLAQQSHKTNHGISHDQLLSMTDTAYIPRVNNYAIVNIHDENSSIQNKFPGIFLDVQPEFQVSLQSESNNNSVQDDLFIDNIVSMQDKNDKNEERNISAYENFNTTNPTYSFPTNALDLVYTEPGTPDIVLDNYTPQRVITLPPQNLPLTIITQQSASQGYDINVSLIQEDQTSCTSENVSSAHPVSQVPLSSSVRNEYNTMFVEEEPYKYDQEHRMQENQSLRSGFDDLDFDEMACDNANRYSPFSGSLDSGSSEEGSMNDLSDYALVQNLLSLKGKNKSATYIALISKAILSTPDKKMLLCDIYQYLSNRFNLDELSSQAWRNSVRHNLSLNECFVKLKREGRGRGHYWAIHPACVDDFDKGDFRRRRARLRAQRNIDESF